MTLPIFTNHLKCLRMLKRLQPFCVVVLMAIVGFGTFSGSVKATDSLASSLTTSKKKVLVLGAYDQGDPESQAKVFGFAIQLANSLRDAEVRAELVDKDPFSSGIDRFRKTSASLFARYGSGNGQTRFDAIVVLDHDSLDFMLGLGQRLFSNRPTVFSSLGKPNPRVFQNRNIYTGEYQLPDIEANIDLAFSQFPETTKLALVFDDTEKGKFFAKQTQKLARDYKNCEFIYLNGKDYTSKQLLIRLSILPQDAVVLWGSWNKDESGPVLSWEKVLRQASQVCPVPIYGFESNTVGNGVIGGKVLIQEDQPQAIAVMLQKIFSGTSPAKIPIQNSSVSSYVFDYPQLARWEISLAEIPLGSYVINRPGIGLLMNQSRLWGISGAIFVIAVLGALVVSVRYRRYAERQWRETEQRFSFIYEESPLAYQSLDIEGRILSVNRAWCELLGCASREEVGQNFSDFLAPDSKRLFLEYWDQCTTSDLGETRIDLPSVEVNLISNHGHVVPVLLYLRKAYDPTEKTTAFYSAMHDISQRREAEDTLRQEDVRLHALLTLNQMLDSSGKEITDYAIRASLELTESERGYLAFVDENEETLTLYAWAFTENGEYFVLNEPTTLSADTTGLWDGIFEERRPILVNDTRTPNPAWHRFGKDSYLPGRRLSVPIFDKDRIVVVASVANKQREYTEHDVQQLTLLLEGMWRIIDRKRTMDKLRDYTNDLENANRQLEECSLAAQQASRAKSEFLANMSHEIRTPMTAIIGFTELLRSEGDIAQAPPARLEAIDTVNRNANYLLFLLNDILDLSKIEAEHLEIEAEHCDLPDLIHDVTKLMETRAITKGLQLNVETADEVPTTIYTDSYRLRQILLNLLGNAVKFTDEGIVRLAVSYKKQAENNRVVFEVVDTGIGISRDNLGQIFDPFTQADSSTSRKFGGTGLGLCISRKLAHMLGGDLSVESELGIGSIFTLSLPCKIPEKIESGEKQSCCALLQKCDSHKVDEPAESQKQDQEKLATLDCRVLVVDDGADNRRLISTFLSKAGARVTLCEDGLMAYEILMTERKKQNHPANDEIKLVLMDMQMPVLDGYQATRKLRTAGYDKPIVAITANAMKKDRDKCLNAGCDAYLAKPIDRTALIQTVATYAKATKKTDAMKEEAVAQEQVQAEFLTTDRMGG